MSSPSSPSSSSLRRALAISRAAWRTLARNPRLVWFTALLGVASLVVTAIAGLLAVLGMDAATWLAAHDVVAASDAPTEVAVQWRAGLGFGLALWFGSHVVRPFFGVALADATLEALAGRPFGVRASLRRASGRIGSIATFAVLDASVGAMLSRLRGGGKGKRRRAPLFARMFASFVDIGWWFATYLVVPVIAREPTGGVAAVGRSAGLMRQTWKEAFVGRLAVRWLVGPVVLAGIVLVVLLVVVGITPTARPVLFGVAAVLAGVLYLAISAVVRTLDTVYRCALYVFATEGVVPEPFDDPALHEIWTVRPVH